MTFLVVGPVIEQLGHNGMLTLYTIPLISVAAAIVLGFLEVSTSGRLARFLSWRPLKAVGQASYGVYLLNYVIIGYAQGMIGGLVVRMAAGISSIALALIMWRFVEQPILRLKSRFIAISGGLDSGSSATHDASSSDGSNNTAVRMEGQLA